jgi:hypothetical protein
MVAHTPLGQSANLFPLHRINRIDPNLAFFIHDWTDILELRPSRGNQYATVIDEFPELWLQKPALLVEFFKRVALNEIFNLKTAIRTFQSVEKMMKGEELLDVRSWQSAFSAGP